MGFIVHQMSQQCSRQKRIIFYHTGLRHNFPSYVVLKHSNVMLHQDIICFLQRTDNSFGKRSKQSCVVGSPDHETMTHNSASKRKFANCHLFGTLQGGVQFNFNCFTSTMRYEDIYRFIFC